MFTRIQWQNKLLLFWVDALAIFAAMVIAVFLRFHVFADLFTKGGHPWAAHLQASLWIIFLWLFLFRQLGLYHRRLTFDQEALLVFKGVLGGSVAILAFTFFYRSYEYSRGATAFFFPIAFAMILAFRALLRRAMSHAYKSDLLTERILIYGAGTVGRKLADGLLDGDSPYVPVGFLDDDPEVHGAEYRGLKVFGGIDALAERAEITGAGMVIIAMPSATHARTLSILEVCRERRLVWRAVPDLYDLTLDTVRFDALAGVPLISPRGTNITGINLLVKRGFDLAAAGLILLVGSPLMLFIAALIKLSSPGPILYRQTRIGYGMRPFVFYKFRTMRTDADDSIHREYTRKLIESDAASGDDGTTFKLQNDPRIVPSTGWLRKFSLDELPQLFNVLKGDMSLVGPRPPIPYEVDRYKEWHKRRFETLPGISGLWQVNGRNHLSFERMVELDIHYFENWNFFTDIKILFKTVYVVLSGRGAY